MPPTHADQVRRLAEAIELSSAMKEEVACLALHLGETPDEIIAEALSELRTLRNVYCRDSDCPTTRCCGGDHELDEVEQQAHDVLAISVETHEQ